MEDTGNVQKYDLAKSMKSVHESTKLFKCKLCDGHN